ncbi:MAG TPA: bifunctional oligoribonuclease/PAP phosphatase NrnA [Chthonomonadaceae bacterium]|nr:bifunctional oligoribonuclease/PAP phosphatase NrnA [Chthonomonadaceae bacterium]
MRRYYREAVDAVCAAESVVIASHVNPDGDSLGCTLGLAHALRALNKDLVAISTDGVPDIYRFLPGAEWIQTSTERRDFDLAIVVDAGALERAGRSQREMLLSAPTLLNIDHHVGDAPFGDIRIVDPEAAATAELIYGLVRALGSRFGRDLMTGAIADCLMTGVITDTGSFRFMNVTPQTFWLAARLQRLGAMPAEIAELVFENRSFASLKLLGCALESLQTTPDGRVAWAVVTAADYARFGAQDAETEGIVNHVRAVRGAAIGVLFREVPGGKVRISLRAREGADVNRIANVFGGGGHRLAAGCSIEPPLGDAVDRVVAECARQLGTPPAGAP